jgi:hypothetical protein
MELQVDNFLPNKSFGVLGIIRHFRMAVFQRRTLFWSKINLVGKKPYDLLSHGTNSNINTRKKVKIE